MPETMESSKKVGLVFVQVVEPVAHTWSTGTSGYDVALVVFMAGHVFVPPFAFWTQRPTVVKRTSSTGLIVNASGSRYPYVIETMWPPRMYCVAVAPLCALYALVSEP